MPIIIAPTDIDPDACRPFLKSHRRMCSFSLEQNSGESVLPTIGTKNTGIIMGAFSKALQFC